VVMRNTDNYESPTYFPELGKNNNKIDSVISNNYEGYTINKIFIKGNTYTREKVIRREIELIPGNKYNRVTAIRSVKKLYCLYYFSDVKLNIDLNTNKTINCIFIVAEKDCNLIEFK
jgi:outer membrane protein assembly factor BamA